MPRVVPLKPLPRRELYHLALESEEEGFAFLRRLIADYDAGIECFDRTGEILLGVWEGPALIAIGGVTRDPYALDSRAGRIRHVYVAVRHRDCGIGRQLVRALVEEARPHFALLTLRTDTPFTARFYERLGFEPVNGPTATHVLPLDKRSSAT